MGTKYSTQTITGYNSSPPPDDGTQVASNLVTWSGQKTKLADPIKTLAEAINTALVADLNYSSRAVTSTDSVLVTDHKKTLQCSGTFTETLLDAATAGAGFHVWIKNNGTGVITVDRATATDTVDSVSSVVTLYTLESALFGVNATANGYLRLVGGSTPDTSPIVHGATDKTKRVRVEADGLTTGTTRVITMPDSDVNLSGLTGTQTANTVYAGPTSGAAALPTFRAPVGADGASLVLIQSQTVSGVATVDFTTGIDSTYDEYVVKFILNPATDATDLYFRLSQNAGSTFKAGTEYNHTRTLNSDGAAGSSAGGTGGAQWILGAALGNAASKRCVGHMCLYEPADTTHDKTGDWKMAYRGSATTITQVTGGGNYTADTAAYNAIRFLMSAGNISGTFSLYGVRKA